MSADINLREVCDAYEAGVVAGKVGSGVFNVSDYSSAGFARCHGAYHYGKIVGSKMEDDERFAPRVLKVGDTAMFGVVPITDVATGRVVCYVPNEDEALAHGLAHVLSGAYQETLRNSKK